MAPERADVLLNSCQLVWDSARARFSQCAVEYFSLIPAVFLLTSIFNYVLRQVSFVRRPKWARPFVSELPPCPELPVEATKQRIGWVFSILAASIFGLVAELMKLILSGPNLANSALFGSWAGTVALIATERPRSSPKLLFAFFLSGLVVEITYLVNLHVYAVTHVWTYCMAGGAALIGCVSVLAMPLRQVSLPCMDISAVGQTPSDDYRSPEDNLRLWQFFTVSWMTPLISLGKIRQLNESDIWFLGFEFQHKRLHEKFRRLRGTVTARLLQANGIDVLIVTVIAIVKMICEFSSPLLLQKLLQAMKDQNRSNRVALTYALLSLAVRFVVAQAQVLNLWYGRRCYERSRGEMIMMVYEKALSRKNVYEEKTKHKDEDVDRQETSNSEGRPKRKGGRRCAVWPFKRAPREEKVKTVASMGKIFNLLRGDVYEVAQRFWDVDALVSKPLGLIIAIGVVWKVLGPSCFLGALAALTAQLINVFTTRMLLRAERVRRTATDSRLQASSQFVEALRHLRWYGWQTHWLRQVMDARQTELKLRIITNMWQATITFINAFTSGLFPVISLYAYTLLAGHTLPIDVIFPALQLFAMLDSRLREIPSLITVLINASISMERIEDFMAEPDKESRQTTPPNVTVPIKMESCSFAWPGKSSPVLSDVSLEISHGLTVIYGKVGAGKTALLQAILGEMDRRGGVSHVPTEMVGYCAQTPWLQSMSIRDNILFSSPYGEQRYKRVIDACELLPDLSHFKHGDLTFVGENGVGLSGGQKARVALARAVYSTARILLLDDPLSALDHNTAESVVRKCLSGPLMKNRVIVLVTHRTHLVRDLATQTVHIEDKTATLEWNPNASPQDSGNRPYDASQPGSSEAEMSDETDFADHSAAVPSKFMEEEHRAEWGVKAAVYWSYIRAGKHKWWAALIILLTIYRLSAVGQSWFLKEWGEAYNELVFMFRQSTLRINHISGPWTLMSAVPEGLTWKPTNPLDDFPTPIENVRPWLLAFFALTTLQAVLLLCSQILMFVIVYCAGKKLFQEVMVGVSHATFRFFDVTPIGRLMNRLTSDIGVVDGNISQQFQYIAFLLITWVSSVLVIASVTPTFLAFSLILTVAFVITFQQFLPTSQSLRRLEMVSLSPLISNFGELLHGLTTVRAFHAEPRFQDRVIAVVDKFQGMDHFYWSLQSWLMYRFESLSALSTFILTVLALYTDVTPGLAAFVLVAADSFVTSTHGLCNQYGQLQMDFVSVERVDELLHVDQEPPGTIDPPAMWPRFAHDITFNDVTIRYAPHLDPSLHNITLRIPGGSTTAVIGRTGSGKSTLAISLLGVIAPESGQVVIDNIDIAQVNKQELRSRVTFVAQDPVLFPGSIRLNLDPTDEYSDTECADVLTRICGTRHNWTLETHVEAGGRNLSQGERQLIGLARAVLRRSSIVILDEATASIDHESSLEIQQILREEMQESTVITVAHRLEAIKDADYYVVLDQGRVSEHGYVRDRQGS